MNKAYKRINARLFGVNYMSMRRILDIKWS